ncbi:hypothetical protein GALL_476720 [mine drainage metagenome]|uniref:Tetratricopeptide repeat protein n=1 Tax=mine drainage metagenome TaxID=410659 RepID=A0A1J5PIT4_9ZZZZ
MGDLEPLPKDATLLQAWAHFHNGEFQKSVNLGSTLGPLGLNVVHKSMCVYARYLEKQEVHRLALFQEVATRAEQQIEQDPHNINARYWRAFALGHYSQGISVAKALAQGLGSKVKADLEHVIRYQPGHADAHIVLGSFHAEVIDKVGSLIGAMAYGASKDTGLSLFSQALKLNIESAFGLVEYANAMLMLGGEDMANEATRLYRQAARANPADAMERLEVELAKAQLAD